MTAYFVASTGTGVGKTFTTCALLHAARLRGRDVRGFKPIISGWDEYDAASDVRQIMAAGETPPTAPVVDMLQKAVNEISPYRFAAPLSPHRAAVLEEKMIDVDALVRWTQAQMHGDDLRLIETVGGVMVPLTENTTTLDWMAAVNVPVILVVGSYLGSISHTLTALAVLRTRGLHVVALVMNETANSSVTLAEAQAGLAPFIADIPLRITQPLVSSWCEAMAIHALEEKL